MKKISFIFVSLTLLVCTLFCACSEDKAVYTAPVIESMTISPNPCYEGDTVTATIVYKDKGENWYYTKYYFNVNNNTTSYIKKEYQGLPNPPSHKFVAKAAGTYSIKFTSEVSPTAGMFPFVEGPSFTQTYTVLKKN